MFNVGHMALEYALMQCCVYHELWSDTNLQKFDALSTARHPRQTYSQYLVSQYSPSNCINLIHTWGLSICKNLRKFFFVLLARGVVRLLFDVFLLFCFPLCYVICEFHRFLHQGWAHIWPTDETDAHVNKGTQNNGECHIFIMTYKILSSVNSGWALGGRFAFIFVISPGHLTATFCHLLWKICQFFEKKDAGWQGWGMGNAGIKWCITIFKTIIDHNLPVQFPSQFQVTCVKLNLKPGVYLRPRQ